MEPTSTASIKAARWLIAGLLVLNLYRAMTQSVTPGEAWNFDRFIGPSWQDGFARVDVNNHVLNTLLVRISTTRFHLTELSLRLPSLLAGVFYLWAVFRIARRWFGDGLPFLAVVGLLTLNPLIIDSLSEARGYGIALACWMWALELLLESVESFSLQKLNLAAMCLGLSVVASLAFASPACALLSVFLVWFKNPRLSQASRLALPQICFLVAFILLVIPLNHADWKTLGVGASSLRQTINEMMALSLGTSTKGLASAIRVALSLAAVATACFALRYWRHREGALAVLTGATLPLTLALLLVAHRWLHTPFPQEGSIYLVPITVLSVATIILKRHSNTARSIFLAFSAVLLARYVGEIPFGMYQSGTQFAGGRLLAKTLRGYAGLGTVRIGVSLAAEPIMSYYRTRYRQGNWQPIDRQPLTAAYDYYVLTPDDAALVDQRHLHILYRDTGLTLAQ